MENASKALIIAASVLLGMMIIGLSSYLFTIFGQYSKNAEQDRINTQIAEFNSRFTKYEGKEDITIHDIISIANLAIENNTNYEFYTDTKINRENSYFITVKLMGVDPEYGDLTKNNNMNLNELIEKYSNNSKNKENIQYFKCTKININKNTKKIDNITFNIIK